MPTELAVEPYYSTLLRQAFDALTPFLSTLPDGTALLNTTPTQQELWKLHAVHARLADAVRRFETAALQAQQPGAQAVATPDDLHTMNGSLCDFGTRWSIDGDYVRCRRCGRPCIASYDDAFKHAEDCEGAGTFESKPWQSFVRILAPLNPHPQPPSIPEPSELRKVAKRNLRTMIRRGSDDKTLMLKCLEELS